MGTHVSGHDPALLGPYRMSWIFSEDVAPLVAAVFAAGAPLRPRLPRPRARALTPHPPQASGPTAR